LKEKGSISLIDFDHIKAKYEASEAKVKMLKKIRPLRHRFPAFWWIFMWKKAKIIRLYLP